MVVNNKVINKLKKGCNYDTLKKLCNRRGLKVHQSRTITELELAYVEGYNVGKSEKADKEFCSSLKEERKQICLNHIYGEYEKRYLKLAKSQIKLLEWLIDECIVECYELSEVGDIEFIEI